MLRNIFICVNIYLCAILLNINQVQAGSANETSDPILLRSGVVLRQFNNETVIRAAAQTSIQDCLCQCHWQTFRDRYGRTHGNCKRWVNLKISYLGFNIVYFMKNIFSYTLMNQYSQRFCVLKYRSNRSTMVLRSNSCQNISR